MVSVSQFINELRRRNVFRSAAAYVVIAWLLIQIADILLEAFAAPNWAMRAIVIALAVSFPVVLILAWVYEITTQGVKRTEAVSEDELISVHTGRQIDFVIIGVLIVAVALFAADRFRWIDFGTAPSIDLRSIAVLPFDNLSGDPEQEYFADGMTETLITELSKISALRVISRQSVMQFKGSNESLPEIARKLNVDAVVEGSALLVGGQVRITVQLIEAATDVHLWADNYDRDLSDVLAIHSEVARAIAREIQIVVTPEEAARLADVREVNPEAYRLYLLGHYHLYKWEPADLEKAVRYFQQAIELDPQYAQPHVGLAKYYGGVGFYGYMPPRVSAENARAEAARALEIDSAMADAHAEYAILYFYYDWDWEKAEEEFRKSISLNSSYAWARQFYAWFLAATDRAEEAHASIRHALELDPLAVLAYMTEADVFWLSRQYDQAIAKLHETLDLFPNEPQALSRLGRNYVQKGMFAEAIDQMERAVTLSPGFIEHYWMLGHAYAVAGETAKARKVLNDLHDLAKKRYVLPLAFAVIHTGLGENDEALEWLERAYQDRNMWMVYLQAAPWFDPLRSDPRFQDLLRRMNFPE
ncbi:MAG: tetratricopeptide repeat protein [Proteobacteria bacterium]|nr:tetratricopeptide repeat protein [Pseudomonadota bacterium]